MYHTPARTVSWEPEVVVQFDRWLALRARIERAWLSGDSAHVFAGCPDSTLVRQDSAFVMCDGPYIVHIRDLGTAPPNLARVQEIASGIWRTHSAVFVNQAELWIDDIRLGDVVRQTGAAGALDLTVAAADVADLALNVSRRDAQFRQLGADPSYVTDYAERPRGRPRAGLDRSDRRRRQDGGPHQGHRRGRRVRRGRRPGRTHSPRDACVRDGAVWRTGCSIRSRSRGPIRTETPGRSFRAPRRRPTP